MTNVFNLISCCIFFTLTGCADGVPVAASSDTATRCHVVMRGDSITNQAGQTIAEFLPNCTVDNLGVDASILADVVQPVMSFDKNTIYTYSYGANECLGERVSVADYRATLNHVAAQGKDYRLVFEAPWRLTHSACRIDAYRQAVVDIGGRYGIPVVIENDQSHSGDNIHLTQAHMRERARLLAVAITKIGEVAK